MKAEAEKNKTIVELKTSYLTADYNRNVTLVENSIMMIFFMIELSTGKFKCNISRW